MGVRPLTLPVRNPGDAMGPAPFEAWKLEPAQSSEALDEWKDFAQQYISICVYIYIYIYTILDIEQSHDTVEDTFLHGHHAGERAEGQKRKLFSREVDRPCNADVRASSAVVRGLRA